MSTNRITVDPQRFTPGQWEELYNAASIIPHGMELHNDARPVARPKASIRRAIRECQARAIQLQARGEEPQWVNDLQSAAATLAEVIGELEHCPNCGAAVLLADAYEDEGEGEEAGRTFYYCSAECMEKH